MPLIRSSSEKSIITCGQEHNLKIQSIAQTQLQNAVKA